MITQLTKFSCLFLLLVAFLTASCQPAATEGTTAYEDINVAEFKTQMTATDVVLLDVRTPGETAEGMIEGAMEIDFRGADFKEKISQLDKDKTYLVYCKSGGRSGKTCNMMQEMGFENIKNLDGGYTRWSAENK